jgi:multiple sugar transport system permease protein
MVNRMAFLFIPVAVAIPRYIIIMNSGLADRFLAHIVPMLAMPVGLFLVKQFIDQVPDALIEAAKIDGAGEVRIIWSVVLPLIQPALATICVLVFREVWGATEASNMFIENDTLRTFGFFMNNLPAGGNPIFAGVSAAASLVMFVPNLIIFIFMQSRVMNTMSHSGIK